MQTVIERARRLATTARRSDDLAAGDRINRDAAIEECELAGYSVREIAAATGLSIARVQGIIVERHAVRQDQLVRAAGLGGVSQGPLATN